MIRRKFLKLACLGTAVAAVPAYGFIATSTKEAAVGLILNELSYLKVDRKEVEQFVEDFHEEYHGKSKNKLYTQLQTKALHLVKARAEGSEMVDLLAHRFLASTDFFRNKMDLNKPVKYTGLYHPYKAPCANPFSAIYYPPETS